MILDKALLTNEYVHNKKSLRQIASELNKGYSTIYYWFDKYQIPRQSSLDVIANHINLTPELIDIINGNLLGDGCLSTNGISARYLHTSKYSGFLDWLFNLLSQNGIEKSGINKLWKTRWGEGYHAQSKNYRELKEIYDRWYQDKKKIVPRDLILTPTIILHWYLGDGCLIRTKKNGITKINFATQGFSKEDAQFLIDLLKSTLHVTPTLWKSNQICINIRDIHQIFSYIDSCPENIQEMYGYKWPTISELKILKQKHEHKNFLLKHKNQEWLYDRYWIKMEGTKQIGRSIEVPGGTIHLWLKSFGIKIRNKSEGTKLGLAKAKLNNLSRATSVAIPSSCSFKEVM